MVETFEPLRGKSENTLNNYQEKNQPGVLANEVDSLRSRTDEIKNGSESQHGLNLLDLHQQSETFPFSDGFAQDITDLGSTDTPVPRNTEKWRQSHQALVDKAKNTEPDLVFYGDSITAGMSLGDTLHKSFGAKAENFGIIGDSTQHLLWRLQNGEADFKHAPEKGVLLIGANNVGNKGTTDDIVRGIIADLHEAQKQMQETKWLVLGVLPQGKEANDPRRAQITEINKKLSDALKNEKNVRFLDVGPKMLDSNGGMSDKVWWGDGLHPKNYAPMFDAIKPELTKL